MEKKPFFKTQSFKCVLVLLIILLLSGSLLTVAYGFMEVTEEERFNRAINKIYGYEMKTEAVEFDGEQGIYTTSEIILARKDTNGDYLVQSKGSGGYVNTVTCWVLVDVENGKIKKVAKVVIGGSDGETLLNNIDYLDKFTTVEYTEGFEFTPGNGFVTSGASMTSNAIDNAVNGALNFVNSVCLGIADPYADYEYTDYIDMPATVDNWVISDGEIKYTIVTKDNRPAKSFTFGVTVSADKTIKSIEIIKAGSVSGGKLTAEQYNALVQEQAENAVGKDLEYFASIINGDKSQITTGATRSNTLCIYAGAFALANYDLVINGGEKE